MKQEKKLYLEHLVERLEFLHEGGHKREKYSFQRITQNVSEFIYVQTVLPRNVVTDQVEIRLQGVPIGQDSGCRFRSKCMQVFLILYDWHYMCNVGMSYILIRS